MMMMSLDAVAGVMQTATAEPLSVTLASAVNYGCSVSVTDADVYAEDSSAPNCPSMDIDLVALTVISKFCADMFMNVVGSVRCTIMCSICK